jgi:retron-type reverse transcriptase
VPPIAFDKSIAKEGGILSPILSNIYLHEFDKHMETLIDKYSDKSIKISKVNPTIVKYSDKLTKLQNDYNISKDVLRLKEIKKVRKERNLIPSRIRTGKRVYYCRYADD